MIYLDYAATTPTDAQIIAEILPYFRDHFGNASSVHQLGRHARLAIEEARETVAFLIHAPSPECVFFTSGATESNNWALNHAKKGILSATTEHEAVLEVINAKTNLRNYLLNPDSLGCIGLEKLQNTDLSHIDLLSLMWVNNETGVVHDVKSISNWAKLNHLLYHCDATQAMGLFGVDVVDLGIDFLSFSGHKIYGTKGAGVLYVAPHAGEVIPFINGGAQERKKRGGTENVVAIVALAAALQIANDEREARNAHLRVLKEALITFMQNKIEIPYVFNGNPQNEVPILNVSFPPVNGKKIDGEMLLLNMDLAGICLSAGSACTSGAVEPSHVLLAMGIEADTAQATLRFSLGKDTTLQELEVTVVKLAEILTRMTQPKS